MYAETGVMERSPRRPRQRKEGYPMERSTKQPNAYQCTDCRGKVCPIATNAADSQSLQWSCDNCGKTFGPPWKAGKADGNDLPVVLVGPEAWVERADSMDFLLFTGQQLKRKPTTLQIMSWVGTALISIVITTMSFWMVLEASTRRGTNL